LSQLESERSDVVRTHRDEMILEYQDL
jgi:hypothetical protein